MRSAHPFRYGVQYTCADWHRFCSDKNLELSVNRRGTCNNNAMAEGFLSSLNTERIKRMICITRSENLAYMFNYFELFFNLSRRYGNNDGATTMEFEKK